MVVRLRHSVYYIGRLRTIGFEAMKNQTRDADEHRIVFADKELVDQPFGGGILPLVTEDNLGHAFDHHHVVGLILVVMPGFDHIRVAGGDIYLTELLKHRVITAEHFH